MEPVVESSEELQRLLMHWDEVEEMRAAKEAEAGSVPAGSSHATGTPDSPPPVTLSRSCGERDKSFERIDLVTEDKLVPQTLTDKAVVAIDFEQEKVAVTGKKVPPDESLTRGIIDMDFLIPPYPMTGVRADGAKCAKRVNESGGRIVYFNRSIEVDEMVCLKLERFSRKKSALKLEFGVTTCDLKSICANKSHVKSACTRDGRPCGGQSFSFQIVRKDRDRVILSFQRMRDSFKVLSEGQPFAEFRDKKKVVKNRTAVPFLILSGDVSEVRIVKEMTSPPGHDLKFVEEEVSAPAPPVPQLDHDEDISDSETLAADAPNDSINEGCRSRTSGPADGIVGGDQFPRPEEDLAVFAVGESDDEEGFMDETLPFEESSPAADPVRESDRIDSGSDPEGGSIKSGDHSTDVSSSGFRTTDEEENLFEGAAGSAEEIEAKCVTPVTPEPVIQQPSSHAPASQHREFVYDTFEFVSEWVAGKRAEPLKLQLKSGNASEKRAKTCFEFLETGYENHFIILIGKTRAKRVTVSGPNIVYFNHCLAADDTISLRVDSFSQPETLNLIFGITTCDNISVSNFRSHIRSFCTNDGRPCGGNSMICRLDRKVRGAGTISFKKVPEGIHFLSDGFLVTQFRDLKNLFRRAAAFPFIALTGDVESVSIVDPDAPAPSPIPVVPDTLQSPLNPEAPPFTFIGKRASVKQTSAVIPQRRLVAEVDPVPDLLTADAFPPLPRYQSPITWSPAPECVGNVFPWSDGNDAAAFAAQLISEQRSQAKNISATTAERDLISFDAPAVTPDPIAAPPAVSHKHVPNTTKAHDATKADTPLESDCSVQLPVASKRLSTSPVPRKWYSNANVRFQNHVVARLRSSSARDYMFSSEIRIGEKIAFKVWKMDVTSAEGVVYFGITTTPILRINFSDLPNDPLSLPQSDQSSKWMMSGNLFNSIGVCDGLTLTRTETGITLSLEPDGDSDMAIISDVDPTAIVYPFFYVGRCVQSLRILNTEAVESIPFKDQVRLYLVFFYLSLYQRMSDKE